MSIHRSTAMIPLLWPLFSLAPVPSVLAQVTPKESLQVQTQESNLERAVRLLKEGQQMYDQANIVEAMPLLQEAADLGLPEAQGFWGFILQKGGTTDAAIDMYRKGSDGGDAFAKLQLAGFFLRGDYLPQDVEQGYALVKEGTAIEYPPAMVVLSNIYAEGLYGLTKDEAKALELLERAAELNDINALSKLHQVYRNGLLGQPVDPIKATAYAEKNSQLQAIKGNSP